MARLTVPELRAIKAPGKRLVSITAYDAPMARLADEAGVDVLLVGDSVAMTTLGYETTLEVTMDDMLHHCRAVVRGSQHAHIVCDLPFMSYQANDDEAMRNAGRALKEGKAQTVKLEGGERYASLVARMVNAGIPVMGHIGLGPQSVNQLGGYPAMGTDAASADAILADARALADAGAWSVVLERVPNELAQVITAQIAIPTIGIAAGPHCDGQVQVLHDVLGLDERFRPRHAGDYLALAGTIRDALTRYADDVREGRFPQEQHGVRTQAALHDHLRPLL